MGDVAKDDTGVVGRALQGRNSHKVLRVAGGILAILTTFVGVWSFIGISFDIKMIVNAFYLVILGFFMLMAQLRVERFVKKLELLRNYTGLGFYYIFVGGLALGSSWYDYVLALVLVLEGCAYLYLSLCKGIKHAPQNYEVPESKAPSEGTTQGAGKPQQFHDEEASEGQVKIEMQEKPSASSPASSAKPGKASGVR